MLKVSMPDIENKPNPVDVKEPVASTVADNQASNAIQGIPAEPAKKEEYAAIPESATSPPPEVVATHVNPKQIKFSAYSQALRVYRRRTFFEKIILGVILVVIGSLIYYYGYYHPIGLYSNFTTLVQNAYSAIKILVANKLGG